MNFNCSFTVDISACGGLQEGVVVIVCIDKSLCDDRVISPIEFNAMIIFIQDFTEK
jgi:hypothetical protein